MARSRWTHPVLLAMSRAKTAKIQPAVESAKRKLGASSSSTPVAEGRAGGKYDLDLEILECPICSEPFSPPVFQCQNGHTVCSSCCERIVERTCPSCGQPISSIRNIAVEKMIESLHARHGCNTLLKYTERDEEHEKKLCEYRPIQCPVLKCKHKDPKVSMPVHLLEEHQVQFDRSSRSAHFRMKASDACVMLKTEQEWLLVWHYSQTLGDIFYCSTFEASEEVWYKLTAERVAELMDESNFLYIIQAVAGHGHISTCDRLIVPLKEIANCELEFEISVLLD